MNFESKTAARDHAWTILREEGHARFPFPVRGRIPNFDGADAAAERLLNHPIFDGVSAIKCNPDSPQKHVRRLALERGIRVYVPTPRLRGGFKLLDPQVIDPADYADAAMLSRMEAHASDVALDDMPAIDLIVTGCVAVTRSGKRCGKGEGYSDLEAAVLAELGYTPAPVVTTVHATQVMDDFPTADHDVRLSVIVTPDEVIETGAEPVETHVRWDELSEEDYEEMPFLQEVRRRCEP